MAAPQTSHCDGTNRRPAHPGPITGPVSPRSRTRPKSIAALCAAQRCGLNDFVGPYRCMLTSEAICPFHKQSVIWITGSCGIVRLSMLATGEVALSIRQGC